MIRFALASLLLTGTSVVAMADSKPLPQGSLSTAQVSQQLQSQGYTVSKIETDDGGYKVKAMGPNHQKTKLQVNPTTGAILSSKVDNDD